MIEIKTIQKPPHVTIAVPGSKSWTNRALLVSSLAKGSSTLSGALYSDDTYYMCNALRKLGIQIVEHKENATFHVTGQPPCPLYQGRNIEKRDQPLELYVGNSGTTTRSLISYVSLGQGEFIIDGDEPMRRSRPIVDLLDALKQLGVSAHSKFNNGHLPVIVNANGIEGGRTRLDASKSSQFLTSLMLIAPYTVNGIEIEVVGELKTPYIDITIAIMEEFGVQVTHKNYRHFHIVGKQHYQPRSYHIEPDASSASYFFAAAAITGGSVTVRHLNIDSAQGDVQFVHVLEQMGCQVSITDIGINVKGPNHLKGIDVDMKDISDTALTLAAIAPFADSKVVIRNIEHTRWQETDRIHAMVTELQKLGVTVVEHQDGLEISPSQITPGVVETYDDHRIAMAFSLIGLKTHGIRIQNPECVSKTFPNYYDVLQKLYL